MKSSEVRRVLYTFCALLTLVYMLVGLVISFNAGTQPTDAAFEASYQVATNSMPLGLFILITGIPMFILFVFLIRRTSKMIAPEN